MRRIFTKILIIIIPILFLILFFYFSINYFIKKPVEIINFIKSDLNENFEIEITNNLNDINNYLKEYIFIESHVLRRKGNEILIEINLEKPFARNNFTQEVIFFNNAKAPQSFFNQSYLDNIKLIDISKKSIDINNYLFNSYQALSSFFKIDKIEYIDDRRYNLVLSNSRVVMLPKVIDSKFLYFIKNNIELINKKTNYEQFLDLRNFHKKTIRLK